MIDFIVYYIIPPVALALSVLFYLSARNSAQRAQDILDRVDKVSQTWQNDIMNFATNLLNSNPSVVGQKAIIAKINAAQDISPQIDNLLSQLSDSSLSDEQSESKRRTLKLLLDYKYHFLQSTLGAPPVVNVQKDAEQISKKDEPKPSVHKK